MEKFERNRKSITFLVLFISRNSEEIKLVYKSEHNLKRENKVLLLINDNDDDDDDDDDDEKYHYFAVKSKLELYSSEWLKSKKQSITNENNCFQNALNVSLDYQRIKKHPDERSKLKPYINLYNWKGIKFPSATEDLKKFQQNNKEIALNILFVPHI